MQLPENYEGRDSCQSIDFPLVVSWEIWQ